MERSYSVPPNPIIRHCQVSSPNENPITPSPSSAINTPSAISITCRETQGG